MLRNRAIASAPVRSASAAWAIIAELVAATLDRSPAIERGDVEGVLAVAAGVGRQLIAGGHLQQHDLVLVAAPVHLAVSTVSGEAALALEENLNPVPGGAQASGWTLYLPCPEPLTAVVKALADSADHLSADRPPDQVSSSVGSNGGAAVDLAAVAARLRGDR